MGFSAPPFLTAWFHLSKALPLGASLVLEADWKGVGGAGLITTFAVLPALVLYPEVTGVESLARYMLQAAVCV